MNRLHCFPLAMSLIAPVAFVAPAVLAQPYPTFSHPTQVTNPFYPASLARFTVALGYDGDVSLRTEDTLLPDTIFIDWAGGRTECIVVQFVAYKDGDLAEVAYDFFAQSDDGTVYYLGEDVFNYQDGEIADTHGTWRAGRDGAPPGIIMSANPFVGQVFHPEDFFPVVFEEDTVITLNEHVMTPAGPITNGLRVRERLLEGTFDIKIYARGYGEVFGGKEDQSEAASLALFVGTQAPQRVIPLHLRNADGRAEDLVECYGSWPQVRARYHQAVQAWNAYRPGASAAGVPAAFVTAVNQAFAPLNTAINARNRVAVREAANELRSALVDVMSVYNRRVPIDFEKMEVLTHDMMQDVRRGDWTAANIEHAKATDAVWARLKTLVLHRPGGACRVAAVDSALASANDAIASENTHDALQAAWEVIEALEDIEDHY